MEIGVVEYVGSIGGVGAVFGILLYLLIRHLIDQMRRDRIFMEDRLTTILRDYNSKCDRDHETQQEFLKVLTELNTYLRMRNGRS